MKLAIGDVVRIRREQTLGTVAGVVTTAGGSAVTLALNGGTTRPVSPDDIELVARGAKPPTPAHGVAVLAFLALGLIAAVINGDTVYGLGASFALTLFVAFTTLTSVTGALINVFLRPRRVRV
ncbi:hypothetical protein [Streptomyces boncukensis]|uniref:Uncharacterized protein n=1 Tax=Streptomyces boncukensis TaxID=2711219 RepID=A0A6G4WSD5_9ACTN|nr:hypothetical protein [Streptomyces boncukensis]NGO67464.1 hypothetical protein [Streptomyces boncukensis]